VKTTGKITMQKTDKFLIVSVPVANLRAKPVDAKPLYIHDDLQQTQVLYNEALLYLDETEDWYYAEAIEQQKYTSKNIWQGYSGWIRKHSVSFACEPLKYNVIVKNKTARILKDLSGKKGSLLKVLMGTKLPVHETANEKYYSVILADSREGYVSKDKVNRIETNPVEPMIRRKIIKTGRLFLGTPYLWGGMSLYTPEFLKVSYQSNNKKQRNVDSIFRRSRHLMLPPVLTGVDCSGLVNLVYLINNIKIPRDAREQWMRARKIDGKFLKPGDLIFVSMEERPDIISHVMLNIDGERFIEALETGGTVRINNFTEKFGVSFLKFAERNFIACNRHIRFGSFIKSQ
jgi:cell wall-associated NlpC family hydrolase